MRRLVEVWGPAVEGNKSCPGFAVLAQFSSIQAQFSYVVINFPFGLHSGF